MGIVNELLDLTEHSSADTDERVALWRQLADDCIARARVLGQPLTLAQALKAGARVKLATGEPEAAIGLLEEEHDQSSLVGGKFAADQPTAKAQDGTPAGPRSAAPPRQGFAIRADPEPGDARVISWPTMPGLPPPPRAPASPRRRGGWHPLSCASSRCRSG